jgi:hypothetical protein
VVSPYFPREWARFVDTYWDRAPMVARPATSDPITSPEEVFQGLQRLGRQYRLDADRPTDLPTHERSLKAENRRSYVKLLFDNKRLLGTDVESLLPYPSDEDLTSYFSRLRTGAGNRGVLLYVTDFQIYVPELWERICSFLVPLYERVGMPGGYADVELFLGQYVTTAGGVHRDTGENFHFVVDGQKTMHVWPRTTFWRTIDGPDDARISAFDPMLWSHHLEDGETFDAKAGDMFYWAPDHWHVGESPKFSVSINIALYQYGRATDCLPTVIAEEIGGSRVPSFPFSHKNSENRLANPPDDIQRFLGLIKSPEFPRRMESAMTEAWLKRTTGFAFGSVPSKRESASLRRSDRVQSGGLLPILWAVTNDDELIYSARGHSSRTRNHASLTSILSRISEGVSETVYNLIQQYVSTDCDRDKVAQSAVTMIDDLYRMRAISLARA